MAEIYRYKGKLYVIRKASEHEHTYGHYNNDPEITFVLAKNGTERPVAWKADVIRTLGQQVTNGQSDRSHRENGHRNRMAAV